jgi:hypothetical protein
MLGGMLVAIIANAIPKLSRKPEVTIVDDIPEAIPLLATGEALMIELIFGATNIPPPIPDKIIGSMRMV